VEADSGGKARGAAYGYELLRVGNLWRPRESDDELELPDGAGPAGAIECVAAVPVSGRVGGAEAGRAKYAECSGRCECARCSAGSEESVAAVSVSGRAAFGIVFIEHAEFGGCEAGTAGRIAGCGELGGEQFEFELQFRLGLFGLRRR
jgi:hypothetical protein